MLRKVVPSHVWLTWHQCNVYPSNLILVIDMMVGNMSLRPRIMLYVVIIILVTTGFRFIYRHRFIIFDYWGLNWQPLLNSHWFWRNCVCPTATPWNTAVLQLIFIDIWRNNLRLRLSPFFVACLSKKDIKSVMVPRLFLLFIVQTYKLLNRIWKIIFSLWCCIVVLNDFVNCNDNFHKIWTNFH